MNDTLRAEQPTTVFGSREAARQLKDRFGEKVKVHQIRRRDNQDVPRYLERLREAQKRAEGSQLRFG